MKKSKKNKLFALIVSLVAAVALWLYVVTVVNPDGVRVISGIPVTFSGQEVLREDQSLLITDGDEQTVSATFYGKNADLNKLLQSQDELSAVVDVTKVRTDKTYSMNYDIQLPNGIQESAITVSDRTPNKISFTVQKLVRRAVEVTGDFSGVSIAEGYMLEKSSFDYETVLVEGPESVVNTIASAQVSMNRSNLEKSVTESVAFTLIDQDGKPVDTSDLSTDIEEIEVKLSVVKYRDVPLDIELIDGGGATSKDVKYTIEPSNITLSGDATVLDGINKIVLGTVDLADMLSNKDVISLPIIIPNDAKNVTGVEEASVTVEIRNKQTAVLRIEKSSFAFINLPEGLEATPVTQQLQVTIRASEKEIAKITTSNIRVVADMTNYTAVGTHTVDEVTVYIDGYPDAGVAGAYSIVVSLAEPSEEEEN